MSEGLKGKIEVVTGGAASIDQAITARYAAEGVDIVIADIGLCSETEGLVKSAGRRVLVISVE